MSALPPITVVGRRTEVSTWLLVYEYTALAPNPPMEQFWAVSVYDIDTRNLFRNEAGKADVSSNSKGLEKNADGSVDVYFGPTAPSGKEANWVQTVPGKFWFPYFRLYAPTQAYFDRSWPLPDIEKAN